MNIIFFLIPIALLISLGFAVAFIWAVKNGQYDDLDSPAVQILDNEFELEDKEKQENG